jgi:phosphosulfolactate phosphohydrolase-like enzyme
MVMAGCDYISCIECGKRMIYDGDNAIRESIEDEICCGVCVKRLKKKIDILKKNDRRRH